VGISVHLESWLLDLKESSQGGRAENFRMKAMGGKLEILATFPDARAVRIGQFRTAGRKRAARQRKAG
jgi:hypothetical protein